VTNTTFVSLYSGSLPGGAAVSAPPQRGASNVRATGSRQNTVWSPTLSSTVKMASTSLRCAHARISPARAAAGAAHGGVGCTALCGAATHQYSHHARTPSGLRRSNALKHA
jgi:hypothetical protein